MQDSNKLGIGTVTDLSNVSTEYEAYLPTSKAVNDALAKKQDTISVSSPLYKSGNAIGVYTTGNMSSNSTYPITSGGVYDIITNLFPVGTILLLEKDVATPAKWIGGTWAKRSYKVALPVTGKYQDVEVYGDGNALGVNYLSQKNKPMIIRYMGGNMGFTAGVNGNTPTATGGTLSNATYPEGASNAIVGISTVAGASGLKGRFQYPDGKPVVGAPSGSYVYLYFWARIS